MGIQGERKCSRVSRGGKKLIKFNFLSMDLKNLRIKYIRLHPKVAICHFS